jgi:hypothetical protein
MVPEGVCGPAAATPRPRTRNAVTADWTSEVNRETASVRAAVLAASCTAVIISGIDRYHPVRVT